jgi:hypothetical protein
MIEKNRNKYKHHKFRNPPQKIIKKMLIDELVTERLVLTTL